MNNVESSISLYTYEFRIYGVVYYKLIHSGIREGGVKLHIVCICCYSQVNNSHMIGQFSIIIHYLFTEVYLYLHSLSFCKVL